MTAYENKRPQTVGFHPILVCTFFATLQPWPAPNATPATGRIENLHRRTGPVGRRRRAFQKIWSIHLHFAIWNFLLPDQPKSPSTAEKPCLNFFSSFPCCPGSTVTTWESLCTLGPVAVATGGPMLFFSCCCPIKPNLGLSLNGAQFPRRLPMQV